MRDNKKIVKTPKKEGKKAHSKGNNQRKKES